MITKRNKTQNKDCLLASPSKETLDFLDLIVNQSTKTSFYGNFSFVVKQRVFPFERSSQILADYLANEESGNVLDMGTGSGIQAIVAYKKGAKKVLAVDIDQSAVENAKENIQRLELEKDIQVLKSNLFESIPPQTFDKIIANLPFTNCNYDCEISHLLFDPSYTLHERFLDQARQYLSLNGKIILVGGDLGDEKTLYSLIAKYQYELVKETIVPFEGINWKIYEICLSKLEVDDGS